MRCLFYWVFRAGGNFVSIPVQDLTSGNGESSNDPICRMKFMSPAPGIYKIRESWSYDGDFVPGKPWEYVSLGEFVKAFRDALDMNAAIAENWPLEVKYIVE